MNINLSSIHLTTPI